MKSLSCLLASAALVLTGCTGADGTPSGAALPAPTVTVTATATETVTVEPDPVVTVAPPSLPSLPSLEMSPPAPPPRLKLRVYTDGCGVIRSRAISGADYHNLTWSVLDQGGFQVLGRNAEGETRYRYFGGGTYTVVLEAYVDGAYRPVSNKVTIRC